MRTDCSTFDAIIMGLDVCLNQLMFLDKILHWCKVFTRIFRCEKGLNFSQPEVQIFNCSYISTLFVCFLQLNSLLSCLLSEVLPLVSNWCKSRLQQLKLHPASFTYYSKRILQLQVTYESFHSGGNNKALLYIHVIMTILKLWTQVNRTDNITHYIQKCDFQLQMKLKKWNRTKRYLNLNC